MMSGNLIYKTARFLLNKEPAVKTVSYRHKPSLHL